VQINRHQVLQLAGEVEVSHTVIPQFLKDILRMCKTASWCICHHLSEEQKGHHYILGYIHLECYHREGNALQTKMAVERMEPVSPNLKKLPRLW
jgi:hypothetical protein